MANLKTLKTRIKSVKSTQKMTKAMKMVAASRLKKAKHLVEVSRPYAEKIREMTSDLASNISVRGGLNDKFPLLTGKGSNEKHLLIVISSDRGLCGGLNSSTVKFAKNKINDLISQGRDVKILCIGKKAFEQLKGIYGKKIIECVNGIFRNNINIDIAESLSNKIINLFDNNEFDVCEVIYSKFKSAISQEQVCNQIIPAPISYNPNLSNLESPINYEPSEEAVLQELLPRNITIQIYNQLLENSASEQGARMSAMESASNNAGKMIKNLTLVYNRTRQANITKELIDIISGANTV
ncbi:MAG: F0F1 ATP synthase subunit gamma [Proteobacteria bacterium]|nr:F0F1 ATP synthase subunit gamma [Pseudomonadota bacterium]NCA27963.1 F0F1 ATP synthase subunit gamma [Pseudomonadota bacterium]